MFETIFEIFVDHRLFEENSPQYVTVEELGIAVYQTAIPNLYRFVLGANSFYTERISTEKFDAFIFVFIELKLIWKSIISVLDIQHLSTLSEWISPSR